MGLLERLRGLFGGAGLSGLSGGRAMEKIGDFVTTYGSAYLYSRMNIEATPEGVAVRPLGWMQYGAATAAAVADILLDVPLLHGAANGVIGAIAFHQELIRAIKQYQQSKQGTSAVSPTARTFYKVPMSIAPK